MWAHTQLMCDSRLRSSTPLNLIQKVKGIFGTMYLKSGTCSELEAVAKRSSCLLVRDVMIKTELAAQFVPTRK